MPPQPADYAIPPFTLEIADGSRKPREYQRLPAATRALVRNINRTRKCWLIRNADGEIIARSAVYSDGSSFTQFRRLDPITQEVTWV